MTSLIEIPPNASAVAGKLGIKADIHSDDFIFHFIARTFGSDVVAAVIRYYNTGMYSAKLIREITEDYSCMKEFLGLSWSPHRCLDFASGYGCVARHFSHVMPSSNFTTCDIHDAAVEFNKNVLGLESSLSAADPADLDLGPEAFDAVFALSFFSHMAPQTFAIWLKALLRLLNPGGILLFTTHGRVSHRKNLHWIIVGGDGAGFVPQSEQKDLDGLSYGTTISYPSFVLDTIRSLRGASLIRFQEGLWWRHQDLYVLERGPSD